MKYTTNFSPFAYMANAKTSCLFMASTSLLLGILLTSIEIAGAQPIGVCNGLDGNNLPSPRDVVGLYRSLNIRRMRIYRPDHPTLEALRDTGIELIVGVPNADLPNIANDGNAADAWVQNNIRNFWPSVRFKYIAVGNEVSPTNGDRQYVPFVLQAMRNIRGALAATGLHSQIRVSTVTYNGLVNPSFPPSAGAIQGEVQFFLNPIISYLNEIGSPILVNVYPYFAYIGLPSDRLAYALFTKQGVEFSDNGLNYQNLFDAIVDATYAALQRAGAPNLEIVVSESGWPTAGGTAASIDNARTYNQNLINHVGRGTPKRPGRGIETYVFAMFNENQKGGPDTERNFGIFFPNGQPIYPINFGSGLQTELYASA